MINSNDSNKINFPSTNQQSDDIGTNQLSIRILTWWSGFSLRTKLLAIATLVVSLLMTGITFFAY